MAVKTTKNFIYNASIEKICSILKQVDFCKLLDVEFIEEAILLDGIEFRYTRKTNLLHYGRNYFVKVKKINDCKTNIAVTTQSKKLTVLFDTAADGEITKIFHCIDILCSR